MINGEKQLRNKYSDLEPDQYQPAGIDLTLDTLSELRHDENTTYGLLKDEKILPKHEEIESKSILINGKVKEIYTLEPGSAYIATTQEKIRISEDSGQFYLPRSSLLRAGVDVRTAFGDPGYNGQLSFLIINHSCEPFRLEKGVRFAQLVDMEAEGVLDEYDGDYGE